MARAGSVCSLKGDPRGRFGRVGWRRNDGSDRAERLGLGASEERSSRGCSGGLRATLVLVVVMVRVGMRVRVGRVRVGDLFDAGIRGGKGSAALDLRK